MAPHAIGGGELRANGEQRGKGMAGATDPVHMATGTAAAMAEGDARAIMKRGCAWPSSGTCEMRGDTRGGNGRASASAGTSASAIGTPTR